MGKRVPKHVIAKIERANKLMAQIIDINIEIEGWVEKNTGKYGFDFAARYRDDSGYGYICVEDFVRRIEDAL